MCHLEQCVDMIAIEIEADAVLGRRDDEGDHVDAVS